MTQQVVIDFPDEFLRLPAGVQARLTELLDRQDCGQTLTDTERAEAEGLVTLAETLSLLKLRAERVDDRNPQANASSAPG